MIDILVGKSPGLQAFVAKAPREVGAAIVDHRRKADATLRFAQQDQAEIMQFGERALVLFLCLVDLFLDFVAAVAQGPIERAARLKLDRLESATAIKDLAALPGNRFEPLAGDRRGQYSIRINDQWRICFDWPDSAPGPSNVEIVDYH